MERVPLRVGGFTLLEVLVVVTAMALLVAILVPSLAHAREQTRQVVCQGNLRQWAMAVMTYANQNQGCLPRRGQGGTVRPTISIERPTDWFNALPPVLGLVPYMKLAEQNRIPRPGDSSIWMCPSAKEIPDKYFFAYGMNMWLSTWYAPEPDRIDRVGPASTMVFLADGVGSYCSLLPSPMAYSPLPRHRGKVNIGFLDSHAAAYTGEYVGAGVGDPRRGDVRWVVPGGKWPGP